jgi:hypothetical protein
MRLDERPLADPGRASMAAILFSEGLSPEEYAARYAHTIYCFSLGECRYADPALAYSLRKAATGSIRPARRAGR